MGAMASIDIPAMGNLISSMSDAASNLPYDKYGLTSSLSPVDVDSSPASKLSAVASWVEQQIPGLRRRLALAQSIEAQSPGFQNVVKIDESTISTMDPTAAQNLGAADAKKLKDSGGKIDPEVLADLKQSMNDPYFAAGLAGALTPTELAEIVTQTSNNKPSDPPGSDGYQTWFDQYKTVVSSLGTTIATATRNTGSLALPSNYADEWLNTIEAKPGDDNYHAAAAMSLGYLMKYGSYETGFLDKISSGVYDYERAHDDEQPWGTRAGMIPSRPIDPSGNGLQTNVDVLAGVLTALGHNPVAAQNFFDVKNPNASTTTVRIDGHDVEVNSRMKYLLLDRQWSADYGLDEGKRLGLALSAATTYFRNSDSTGRTSATIASQTFALLGNQIGQGSDNWGIGHTWNIYKELRPSVARMIASYSPDLYRIVGIGGNGTSDQLNGTWTVDGAIPGFPPGTPTGAAMDLNLMKKIIGTLGEDESNIQIVTVGVAAAQRTLMSYALSKSLKDNPNTPVMMITGEAVPLVENTGNLGSSVLGWVVNNAYQGDKADEDAAAKRAAMISKTLSIVSSLPCIPAPAGEWSQFIFDQAKDYAIDKIGEGPEGDSTAVYGRMDQQSKAAVTNDTLNYLLRSGYLQEKYYDAANRAVGGDTYEPPPPGALKTHYDANGHLVANDPPEFDFSSKAYQGWSRTYAPNNWLQTNVLGPYNNAFPNIG